MVLLKAAVCSWQFLGWDGMWGCSAPIDHWAKPLRGVSQGAALTETLGYQACVLPDGNKNILTSVSWWIVLEAPCWAF